MTSSTNTILGYMFAENRYINLKFGMLYDQACFYDTFDGLWKILKIGFCKKVVCNFSFLFFCGEGIFF